jgi:O-antigen/teichoic acid export membrane protein
VAVILGSGVYTPLNYLFVALSLAAFVVEAWAFVDAIVRPAQAYTSAGKQTKTIWLLILGVAFVLGLAAAAGYGIGITNFLAVAAFVAAAIYLVDVRPKVKEFRRGTSNSGPYGPW